MNHLIRKILTPFIITLLWIISGSNAYSQSCNYTSSANDMQPDKLCAPVTAQWTVTYRGVDDGGAEVRIYIDWNDGSTPKDTIATQYEPNNYRVTASHVYKGGDQCNYEPRTMLIVNGVPCPSSVQTQLVTVWDVDNENGGKLSINPEIFPICFGNDGTVQFSDVSQWNCTPPDETDNPNSRNRWTQWIYGTGGTTITTAQVNGAVQTWPYSTPIDYYPTPIPLPIAPSPPPSLSEPIYIPMGYNVGDFFEVTIRNWNTCNPYDDPNITGTPLDVVNGDNPPIETTAMALIVALPDGTITPVGPFCENGSSIMLTPATSGGTWAGPGIVNTTTGLFDPAEAGAGTHHITYDVTDPNGCSATGSLDIEVKGSPTVAITAGAVLSLCPGITQTLTANISGGTPPYTIAWSGDTAPLSATNISNPNFSTLTQGVYDLTLTATDQTGCTDEATISITVEALEVSFTPNTIEICAGTPIQLNPVISGGSGTYLSHTWSGSATDKLSATDIAQPVFTSLEVGSVILTLQVTDDQGCTNQADITIEVKEPPVADAGPDQLICGSTFTLLANTYPTATGQWQVLSGPGNLTFSDPTHPDAQITSDAFGAYDLSWELTMNGCSHTDQVTLTFSPVPTPTTGDDASVCGLTTNLQAFPDLATGTWSLRSGPGNSTFTDATDPLTGVSVDTPGSYTFVWSEESPDLCMGTADQTIEFRPQAIAQITPPPAEGCSPLEVDFTNESVNADSYRWDFGDGGTSNEKDPIHIFENNTSAPITNTITLIARNSDFCNDTLRQDITTNPSPRAHISADPVSGCAPMKVGFTNNTSGGNSYAWSFSDDGTISTDFEPVHLFNNTESYVQSFLVNLTTTNLYGCSDSAQLYISVFPDIELTLKATPSEGCSPLEVTLVATPGFQEYQWDFGDGQTATGDFQITHIFENTGSNETTFAVTVTGVSSMGCYSTATTQVIVHPSPIPLFTASPQNMNMPLSTVTLGNNTAGSWDYLWTFGDGSVSNEADPGTHTYTISGTYDIVLQASSAHCQSETSETIVISPMLPAIDYGQDTEGCPPLTVEFWNNTLDATSYIWDFGDGQISGEKAPTHIYQIPGLFNVQLTATGAGGTAVAQDVTVNVYPTPSAQFEAVPTLIYIPDNEVAFMNRSTGAINYEWDFGDGETSTEFLPSHLYTSPGLFDVTLKVENELGCTDEYTVPGAVKAEQGGEMSFPNAFTPNTSGPLDGQYSFGDRRNQVFYPSVQKGIVEYRLQIFNRWGELLFQSDDLQKGWDGYYKNKLCPQGVYIWRVRAKFSNGHISTRAGDVTLLR